MTLLTSLTVKVYFCLSQICTTRTLDNGVAGTKTISTLADAFRLATSQPTKVKDI